MLHGQPSQCIDISANLTNGIRLCVQVPFIILSHRCLGKAFSVFINSMENWQIRMSTKRKTKFYVNFVYIG